MKGNTQVNNGANKTNIMTRMRGEDKSPTCSFIRGASHFVMTVFKEELRHTTLRICEL